MGTSARTAVFAWVSSLRALPKKSSRSLASTWLKRWAKKAKAKARVQWVAKVRTKRRVQWARKARRVARRAARKAAKVTTRAERTRAAKVTTKRVMMNDLSLARVYIREFYGIF